LFLFREPRGNQKKTPAVSVERSNVLFLFKKKKSPKPIMEKFQYLIVGSDRWGFLVHNVQDEKEETVNSLTQIVLEENLFQEKMKNGKHILIYHHYPDQTYTVTIGSYASEIPLTENLIIELYQDATEKAYEKAILICFDLVQMRKYNASEKLDVPDLKTTKPTSVQWMRFSET
jgi:hypothetical protein